MPEPSTRPTKNADESADKSAERTLNHFASFAIEPAYFELEAAEREALSREWLGGLGGASERAELYQVYPARHDTDLVVWSALPFDAHREPRGFFDRFARATTRWRAYFRPTGALWGLTRASPYVPGRPPRGIQPLSGERATYLIFYPFTKTAAWYVKGREARQGMMNEHIRIGRTYPEVDQLLLYSFGLQDQEFVVVYETEDLARYSELVAELRGCEARLYTDFDTPITTAVHRAAATSLAFLE